MSQDLDAQLVRMINQITVNLNNGKNKEEAIVSICQHLERFWARPMKRRMVEILVSDSDRLEPLARDAVQRFTEREAKKPPTD
ncbi:formate dehydrogenase subunit delta [Halomonas sp.]|uniref:formate dehydrogenase subunit delta n=1 Tax=Halomonas sp. TaxID=1486246 RepID=UPI003D0D23AB